MRSSRYNKDFWNGKVRSKGAADLGPLWGGWGFTALVLIVAMILFAVPVSAIPTLNFTFPTPENNSYISTNHTQVNITISEPDLDTFRFNWNTTNYTFYDSSLVLAMNFNNNSTIGENSTKVVDISKYGNNGTCSGTGCPSSTTGKFGKALSFDGVDEDKR